MDDNQIKKTAEAIVDAAGVEFKGMFDKDEVEDLQLGFWIPAPYKLDFAKLQRESDKKFGRLCKHVIMVCIDRAKAERDAS